MSPAFTDCNSINAFNDTTIKKTCTKIAILVITNFVSALLQLNSCNMYQSSDNVVST